jgi:penicillin-binding protein 1C
LFFHALQIRTKWTTFSKWNFAFISSSPRPNVSRLKVQSKTRRRILRYGAVAVVAVLLGWFALPFGVSLPVGLLENPTTSPVLLDRHGVPIVHLALADSSRASRFTLEDLPADFVACTLAAEDQRFYNHGGIDLFATLRAGRDFITHRRVVSGASTITQQLIKISSPPSKRGPWTKIYEALAARRLEMKWSKNRILTAYLNRLDYGNLRTGCAEATRFYFQKPLAELSLAECALLAGLPQAPSRLNPIRHPQQAIRRRNTVLNRLAHRDSTARITLALAEPVVLRPLAENRSAPWLAQMQNPTRQLQTTLDLSLQRELETIVREETSKLREANLRHAAVVVIDNPSGEILALVSSADWDDPRGGQLNGALSPRSPGSTLKPFTYLLAMERNHRHPVSILADIPTPFSTSQGLDLPENYDRHYRGPVTLRTALACSLNVPALRELNLLGGARPLYDFLQMLGITTFSPDPDLYGLGLTLGNAPVRLLEITNAYATLARLGRHRPASLFPSPPSVDNPVCDRRNAWLLADILSDSAARAPSFQPGGPLDLPFRCAVKTGTSSDFHDNWCIGYTPEFTVGVWAGNFEQQPMKSISGITGAGPIFHRAMLRLHQDRKPSWFERPPGLVDVTIDPRNGKLTAVSGFTSRPDIVPMDRVPVAATSADCDASGKARLDPTYAEWFASRYNSRRNELALDPAKTAREPLRIISPADNATFLLDPEIPSGSNQLRPVTNLPGAAVWKSESLVIEPASPEPIIHLVVGTHIVTATDPATGRTHSLTLRVKSL